MIFLSIDEIISLHNKLITTTGGSNGLREYGLLESAVFNTLTSFGDNEAYPSTEEKAARLMFSLVSNHAFVDGNKRTGVLIMLMTLRLNHIALHYTQSELIHLGLSVASGESKYDNVLDWIRSHTLEIIN